LEDKNLINKGTIENKEELKAIVKSLLKYDPSQKKEID
jgi:hypothetical protein